MPGNQGDASSPCEEVNGIGVTYTQGISEILCIIKDSFHTGMAVVLGDVFSLLLRLTSLLNGELWQRVTTLFLKDVYPDSEGEVLNKFLKHTCTRALDCNLHPANIRIHEETISLCKMSDPHMCLCYR